MTADQAQGVLPLPWFLALLLIVPAVYGASWLCRAVQRAAKQRVDTAIEQALTPGGWPAPRSCRCPVCRTAVDLVGEQWEAQP